MTQDELTLKVWREPAFGVYHYEISNANEVAYIQGTDTNPYGVVDTLANEMYDIGWKNTNDA